MPAHNYMVSDSEPVNYHSEKISKIIPNKIIGHV
jgi:hypothetical protein